MPTIASERRKIYLERKERGYCPRCGNKINAKPKTVFCDDCKNYFKKYNKDNAEIINATKRERTVERRQTKRCTRCGKFLAKEYIKKLCVNCLDKTYKYNNGKKRPKGSNKNNFFYLTKVKKEKEQEEDEM